MVLNIKVAEREGFEPSIEIAPYTPLAGERLRPLGHLSKNLLDISFNWRVFQNYFTDQENPAIVLVMKRFGPGSEYMNLFVLLNPTQNTNIINQPLVGVIQRTGIYFTMACKLAILEVIRLQIFGLCFKNIYTNF